MDDSNPVASALQLCFGDEEDDEAAYEALVTQLSLYPALSARFRAALDQLLATGDEAEATSAVEAFANRDLRGSGREALAWLGALRDRLRAAGP
jgi:hypothetical protein